MVFVINKKRILTITICLVLTFIFLGKKENNKIVETVALPVEDKIIVIDAGHGLPDERSF